jgi:hypothetical protein
VLLAVAGCAARPRDLVIGKWQPEGTGGTIEFTRDGQYKVANGKVNYAGQYTFVDEDTVEIQYAIPEDVFTAIQAARLLAGNPLLPGWIGNVTSAALGKLEDDKNFKGKAKVTLKGDDLTLAFPDFTVKLKKVR